ncbi:MAG: zinc ribbon domain-containing protein [Bacteroidetes bacterium]|nr:zinc ribbon domain-containing protein [Bacteroidota bacterium]
MPRYDYKCLNCGYVAEHTHAITVKLRNVFCFHCHQWARVKRLVGQTTFILKGSGWGSTGYQEEKKQCTK